MISPKNSEVQVLMNDFTDIFPKATIEKRRQEILECKKRNFEVEPLGFSRRCELLLLDGIVKDNWLGKGIVAAEASEYDDLKNGVDLYVDFGKKFGVIGIDLTLSKQPGIVARKLSARNNFPIGFTNLNFYTNGHTKSGKRKIPRFVIGINPQLMSAAQKELGLSEKRLRTDNFSRLGRKLREAILMQLYLEILLEIEFYKNSTNNKELITKLENLQPRFWELLAVNIERRKKLGLLSTELKRKSFKQRQRIILNYFLSTRTSTFGCVMKTLLELADETT